jgi:CelD/BcsL family acetyltransferase involved in cellulose biosynthesis
MIILAKENNLRLALEPLPQLDLLEHCWRALDRIGTHSFYLTWTWIGTWLRVLPPDVPATLLRATHDAETVALAVLTSRRATLHRVLPLNQYCLNSTGDPALDCIMIEHNGFACDGSFSRTILQLLAKSFATRSLAADELAIPGVGVELSSLAEFIDAGHASPAFCAPLDGLGGAQGVEPLLSRNARQQLRRTIRRCERIGPLTIEIAPSVSLALEFFDGLKSFHMRGWTRRGRTHAFSDPFFETFHRALIVNGVAEGSVNLVRVSAGPYILGYLYNFLRNGTVSNYQSGFNDADLGLRPGYVCHALAMSHYATLGMSNYDLLAGTNRLKNSFAPQRYQLWWRRLRRRTPAFRAEALIREASGRLGNGR